jgi:hypothetical protein
MPLMHLLTGMALASGTNSGLPAVVTISSIAAANGTVGAIVTTATAHGLADNQPVTIASVTTATGLNATWPVRVITATTFELVGSAAVAGTPGGTPTYTIPTLDIATASLGPNLMIQSSGDGLLEIQDSVDAFSNLVRRKVLVLKGEQNTMLNWADFADLHRFGVSSARLRVVCTQGSFSRVAVQFKN